MSLVRSYRKGEHLCSTYVRLEAFGLDHKQSPLIFMRLITQINQYIWIMAIRIKKILSLMTCLWNTSNKLDTQFYYWICHISNTGCSYLLFSKGLTISVTGKQHSNCTVPCCNNAPNVCHMLLAAENTGLLCFSSLLTCGSDRTTNQTHTPVTKIDNDKL